MRIRKLHVILGIATFIIVIAGYVAYLFKYQQLVVEGARLADQHCIAINPLIIQRKRAYIDGMKTIMASGSAGMESYLSYQDQYVDKAKKYASLEREWLRHQRQYLDRAEVQFFLDADTKEAMDWQYTMYRAELEATEAIVRMFQETGEDVSREALETITRADRESRIAQQAYDLKWKARPSSPSFRDRFISVPESQCPEENTDFPNVEQELGI